MENNVKMPFDDMPDAPRSPENPGFWEHVAELLEKIERNTAASLVPLPRTAIRQKQAAHQAEVPALTPGVAARKSLATSLTRPAASKETKPSKKTPHTGAVALPNAPASGKANAQQKKTRPDPGASMPGKTEAPQTARAVLSSQKGRLAGRAPKTEPQGKGGLPGKMVESVISVAGTTVSSLLKGNLLDYAGHALTGPVWGAAKEAFGVASSFVDDGGFFPKKKKGREKTAAAKKAVTGGRDAQGRFVSNVDRYQKDANEFAESALELAGKEAVAEKKRHDELLNALSKIGEKGTGLRDRRRDRGGSATPGGKAEKRRARQEQREGTSGKTERQRPRNGQREAPETRREQRLSRQGTRTRNEAGAGGQPGTKDRRVPEGGRRKEARLGRGKASASHQPGIPRKGRGRAQGRRGLLGGLGGAVAGGLSLLSGEASVEDIALDAGMSLAETPGAGKIARAASTKTAGLFGKMAGGLGRLGSGAGKVVGGAGKLAGLGAKGALGLARALPGLGQVLTIGMAALDGYQGWNDTNMHKAAFGLADGEEANVGQKASAAVANILDMGGLLTGAAGMLGFDVSTADIAKGVYAAGESLFTPFLFPMKGLFNLGENVFSTVSGAWEGISKFFSKEKEKSVAQEEATAIFGEMAGALENMSGLLSGRQLGGEPLSEPIEGLSEAVAGLADEISKEKSAKEAGGVNGLLSEAIAQATSFTSGGATGASRPPASPAAMQQAANIIDGDLGSLSAHYESGRRGSAAIGWDRTGGTSYGKYQIASRTGTMSRFLAYARDKNPEVYERLKNAGPADAGKNGRFAQEWQALASEGKLGSLEHDFIKATHFDPAFAGIRDEGLRKRIEGSKTLQDVLWSTSVQHGAGGASNIVNGIYRDGMSDEEFINALYARRGTKFGSSDAATRQAVQKRFVDERGKAVAMLAEERKRASEAPQTVLAQGAEKSPGVVTATHEQVASSGVRTLPVSSFVASDVASGEKKQATLPATAQVAIPRLDTLQESDGMREALTRRAPRLPEPELMRFEWPKMEGGGASDKMLSLLSRLVDLTQEQTRKMDEKAPDEKGAFNIPMEFDDLFCANLAHDRG